MTQHPLPRRRSAARLLPVLVLVCGAIGLAAPAVAQGTANLLNVSYDPTRELYADYNKILTAMMRGAENMRRS